MHGKIEIRVRARGDATDWEMIEIWAVLSITPTLLRDLRDMLHDSSISEIRWNRVSASQGHYMIK